MDYKEKYEELRSKIQNLHDRLTGELRQAIEEEVPETMVSEDERISKELLNYLFDVHDDDEERARWIAWLEKQGKKQYGYFRSYQAEASQVQGW